MSNAAIATARFSPATVTRQPDRTAHKFVLTGRSGIGKTFLASTIPGVFIIPVEEGLKGASPDHEPAHFAVVPRSLRELHQALDSFVDLNGPGPDRRRPYTHLAIDSLSGVEALVHDAALEAEHARHMDGKDYKVVWSAASSLWTEVQRKLDAIRRLGVHVWLIAHATETVDATVSGDTFRKWDLAFKGSGGSLAEVRQFWRAWADHVFFLDWVAKVVPGSKGKRAIGKYEGRVLYTRESATHYAKTRARLPPSIPATWDDLARALAAGSIAPEAKLRAQLADLLPQLEAADRAIVEAELGAAKGANRLAALVSRAQGMLAVSREEAPEETDAAAGEEKAPDTARAPTGEPAANESAGNGAEVAAPADLCAEPAAEPTADETAATADPTPTVDPAVVALAAELERQISEKAGAELEAMPDVVKAAKLPALLEARIRKTYVARVRSLRSATALEQQA